MKAGWLTTKERELYFYLLDPTIDGDSLKKPALQKILSRHGYETANKRVKELRNMFDEDLCPRREELLEELRVAKEQKRQASPPPTKIHIKMNEPSTSSSSRPATSDNESTKKPIKLKIDLKKASTPPPAASPAIDNEDDDEDSFAYDPTDIQDEEEHELREGQAGLWGEIDNDEIKALLQDQIMPVSQDEPTLLYYPSLHFYVERVRRFGRHYIMPRLFTVICATFALFAIISAWYAARTQRLANGYCDSTLEHLPAWAKSTNNGCIPCPDNATCRDGQLICHPMYVAHRSFINQIINVFYPLPQDCVKNKKIDHAIAATQARILRHLAKLQGRRMCQLSWSLRAPEPSEFVYTTIDEIDASLTQHLNALTPDPIERDHILKQAWDHLEGHASIIMKHTPDTTTRVATTDVSYSPWCLLRHYLLKLAKPVLILVLLYAGATNIMHRIAMRKMANDVVEQIIDFYEDKRIKYLNKEEASPGCSIITLRALFDDPRHPDLWPLVKSRLKKHRQLREGETSEDGDRVEFFQMMNAPFTAA
ncbi:Man1-Src1p-C-terminal domain-containing protein [Gongronella butleri]|nr:Man1-Src1p-C-terminal domain-containing protein [Gongronella butleri]